MSTFIELTKKFFGLNAKGNEVLYYVYQIKERSTGNVVATITHPRALNSFEQQQLQHIYDPPLDDEYDVVILGD